MDLIKQLFKLGGTIFAASSPLYAQQQPNIIVIMADDLGWSDLGIMGSDYYETPHIDRLASQGTLFTNAYAGAANSAPSRACFITGKYTPRHGVFTVSPADRGDKTKRKLLSSSNNEDVDASFVTVAEALQQLGYNCAHIGKWHLGDDKAGTGPLSQGFNLNIGGDRSGSPYSYFFPYCNKSKSKCHVGLDQGRCGEYLTDRLSEESIRFISDHHKGNKPFFLYLAHYAVHKPLKAPDNLIDKYSKKKAGKHHQNPVYAAMIESLDQSVGKICHALDSLKITDNTLLVFCSDNGGSEPVTDNYPLRGGKGMPYEGGIRVPLIMKWPGKIPQKAVSNIPVTSVDLYPTLISAANGMPSFDLDGENILLLSKAKVDRPLFWHFPAYLESYERSTDCPFRATPYSIIRLQNWKLIYYYEDQSVELFDLQKDSCEKQDLSKQNPTKRKELYSKLMSWLKETKAPIPNVLNPAYIHKSQKHVSLKTN